MAQAIGPTSTDEASRRRWLHAAYAGADAPERDRRAQGRGRGHSSWAIAKARGVRPRARAATGPTSLGLRHAHLARRPARAHLGAGSPSTARARVGDGAANVADAPVASPEPPPATWPGGMLTAPTTGADLGERDTTYVEAPTPCGGRRRAASGARRGEPPPALGEKRVSPSRATSGA